ncbi:MAG: hypothetical protein CMD29_05530 [Flavobacteriales bacterium]|nr:hypothetical protein [Flavobacteriales bacterium]|tara:strand:+ start:333 stop:1226 length:894 start_codon:yes stop_codon:yes gene_type:complete
MVKISSRLNDFLKRNQIKLTLIDIGARGEIQKIWKPLVSNLKIIGFEPDKEEFNKLVVENPKKKYFNTALSNKREKSKLFITKDPSCSSLFKSHIENINVFESHNWESKRLVSTQNIQCDRLDELFDGEVDYIKIDTQGSELKILMGAEKTLINYHPIVSCETWCTEVYKDAPKFNEVINYMDKLGYEVFDIETAASWKYISPNKVFSRKRKIGFEILFVKSHTNLDINHKKRILKHSLILEYLGFRDYSIFLDSLFELNLNKYFLKNNNMFSEYIKARFNTILYFINKLNLFPSYR